MLIGVLRPPEYISALSKLTCDVEPFLNCVCDHHLKYIRQGQEFQQFNYDNYGQAAEPQPGAAPPALVSKSNPTTCCRVG